MKKALKTKGEKSLIAQYHSNLLKIQGKLKKGMQPLWSPKSDPVV